MRAIIIILSFILTTLTAYAGAPGHKGYVCQSDSGRTLLTLVDKFEGGEGLNILFSIDGFSKFYDKETMVCTPDECQRMTVSYTDNSTIYSIYMAESLEFQVEIGYDNSAMIKKGFIHPKTFEFFDSNIYLTCTQVQQQI